MKNKLIDARKDAGISQTEMAKKIGLKPNTYNQYELGVRNVPFDVAEKIAGILCLKVDELFLPQKLTIKKV